MREGVGEKIGLEVSGKYEVLGKLCTRTRTVIR